MIKSITPLLICLCLGTSPLEGQHKLLTLEDIYHPDRKIDFSGAVAPELHWLVDGTHYVEQKKDSQGPTTLFKVEVSTGKTEPLFDPVQLEEAFAKLPGFDTTKAREVLRKGSFKHTPDGSAILIESHDDLFYHSSKGQHFTRLTDSPQPEREARFSPNGTMVSFVRDYNLYVIDLDRFQERQLTTDGNSRQLNGLLDWVYQEEIYGRGDFKGYWWSPDSTHLVYLQIDESEVPEFKVVDQISRYLEIEVTNYPKAGDPNPRVRLGILPVAAGGTTWVDTSKYRTSDFLIVRVGWTPDSRKVVYQVQNRQQTWLELNLVEVGKGKPITLLRETSPAWVDIAGQPIWLKDGSFLWLSERTGWRHVYHYSGRARLLRALTSGPWKVEIVHGVDEKGFVYLSGTAFSSIESHVYRVKLDLAYLEQLSRRVGTHRADFNPPCTFFIDSWSDTNIPPQVRLYRADGSMIRVIHRNRVDVLNEFQLRKPEFLQVSTRDRFVMEAMIIKPPEFDPTQKYPVMSFTYGGPYTPMVRKRWRGKTYMWYQFLAQKGYLIWICDNRSASDKGTQATWPVYKNFGELELRDLEDGLKWLKGKSYVDGSRIGLGGWSFGGFMTGYALTHSKSFKIGIAAGPVTDWRLYDTIYTERYMTKPQDNPEGYDKSSVSGAAADLHGKLLLIHGTMDDNVHAQHTFRLVYELQKAGKQFEVMFYPKSRHNITDLRQSQHLAELMTNFILENL